MCLGGWLVYLERVAKYFRGHIRMEMYDLRYYYVEAAVRCRGSCAANAEPRGIRRVCESLKTEGEMERRSLCEKAWL
jgi:hypothetical protein